MLIAIANRLALEEENKTFTSVSVVLSALEKCMKYVDPRVLVDKALTLRGSVSRISDVFGHTKELELQSFSSIYAVGAGKAASRMAQGVCQKLGQRIAGGAINVPYETRSEVSKITMTKAGHPSPDQSGIEGTKKIINILEKSGDKDLIIVLLSGGASALMPLPRDEITLKQKKTVIGMLMSAGASIRELNVVRKHLSMIKGGQMLRFVKKHTTIISFVISDVVGDDLEVIASGPTFPDSSTYNDAANILKKYNLWNKRRKALEICKYIITQGIHGDLAETPKPGDERFENVHNFLIGNNTILCKRLVQFLKRYNINSSYLGSTFDGEAKSFGKNLAKLSSRAIPSRGGLPFAYVMGGETIVRLNQRKSNGIGGRNQEAVLAALMNSNLAKTHDVTIACIGTDGIDGNSKAAGALITPHTSSLVKKRKINLYKYLYSHDSFSILDKLNSTIKTGLTETNVNDIAIVCRLK